MQIKYSYYCGKSVAYQRIDNLLKELQKEHADKVSDLSQTWNDSLDYMDFSFKVKGFNVSGNIDLSEKNIVLNGKIPFAARMFSKKIKSTIESTLNDLFS